jgi:hypothetical protein
MKLFYEELLELDYSNSAEDVKQIVSDLDKAEIFRIQNVADYMMNGTPQEEWSLENDFPNIAPPFEIFWMEYTLLSTLNSEGIIKNIPDAGNKIGFLFRSKKITHKGWAMIAAFFCKEKNEIIHGNDMFSLIGVDADGKIGKTDEDLPALMFMFKTPPKNSEIARSLLQNYIQPVFLAISFLHCKNVKIVKNNPVRGRRRNRNQPKIDYHTLEIEPMKQILRQEGNSEETGLQRALHICRGHFKDYTNGRGLFGRYRDVFWWDSQVRGHSEAGIVLKDYDIKEPKQP